MVLGRRPILSFDDRFRACFSSIVIHDRAFAAKQVHNIFGNGDNTLRPPIGFDDATNEVQMAAGVQPGVGCELGFGRFGERFGR